ncbi:MAG: hypothetical protein ACT4N2_14095 [Hyphomicrobium sp.]
MTATLDGKFPRRIQLGQYRVAWYSAHQADRMKPERVVKERVPNPGRGDTGRGKK